MLKDKAVVITGSGRGIGAECAKGVARRGAKVVVNDVDAASAARVVAEIEAAGGRAIACLADVSDWGDAGRLIQSCIDAFGRIDGLVNNAAVFNRSPITHFDPKVARALVEVNVLGPLYSAAHAVTAMVAQGSGSIVNIVSGAHMGIPSMHIYGATKGAVASMVYGWAMELAGTGVRVNGVSPFGATNLLQNSRDYISARFGVDVGVDAGVPVDPNLATRGANSPLVEYLLSDQAADVNGQLVRIDENRLILITHPALLLPAATGENWTAETIADAFATDLKHRQIPCGIFAMEHPPVSLEVSEAERREKMRQADAGKGPR